jgi:hypothetical protein
MMPRLLAACLLLAALAVTPACRTSRPNAADRAARDDGYPARYPRIDPAARAERERTFRARNPGPWLSAALDPYGFFVYVTRPDADAAVEVPPAGQWKAPPFTPEELAFWRDVLVRNAALFGIADVAVVSGAGDAHGIKIEQRFRGNAIAIIQVGRYGPSRGSQRDEPGGSYVAGHLWPRMVEPSELLSDEDLADRVVGREGVVVLQCGLHPCDPAGPDTPCPNAPPSVRTSHTVEFEDIRVIHSERVVNSQGGHGPAEVRLLAALELLPQPCPAAPPACDRRPERCPLSLRAKLEGTDQGWAVDRVTGEILRDPYFGAAE